MKLATLACLALLGLVGSTMPSPAQSPAPAGKASAGQPQAAAPRGTAAQPPAPATSVGRAGSAGTRAERRRRSYAACNRASHQRGLSGGRRRRFLIRCRLGYERPRQPAAAQGAAQPAPQAAPTQPSPQPAPQPGQGARP